jgi:hypothetical protein
MPKYRPSRRQPILGALLPLPAIVAALMWFGVQGPLDRGTAGNLSFGVVDATAEFVSPPPMSQMMMPHSGADHGGEIQVTLQFRNDTDRPVTIPFGRLRMRSANGTDVAPVAGLLGDLPIRPHAAVEERLRFPAPDADQAHQPDQVQLRIPDGDAGRTLTLPLRRPGSATPSGPSGHHGDHR